MEISENGEVKLKGVLDFNTVLSIENSAKKLFKQTNPIIVDLKEITYSDSSGLALLSEWTRKAHKESLAISFKNMPQQMVDIARVTGVDQLLPISTS